MILIKGEEAHQLGEMVEYQLDIDELKLVSKIAQNNFYSDERTWSMVTLVYKNDGNKTFQLNFRIDQTTFTASPILRLIKEGYDTAPSLVQIVISDNAGGKLIIKRDEIPDVEELDILIQLPPQPLTWVSKAAGVSDYELEGGLVSPTNTGLWSNGAKSGAITGDFTLYFDLDRINNNGRQLIFGYAKSDPVSLSTSSVERGFYCINGVFDVPNSFRVQKFGTFTNDVFNFNAADISKIVISRSGSTVRYCLISGSEGAIGESFYSGTIETYSGVVYAVALLNTNSIRINKALFTNYGIDVNSLQPASPNMLNIPWSVNKPGILTIQGDGALASSAIGIPIDNENWAKGSAISGNFEIEYRLHLSGGVLDNNWRCIAGYSYTEPSGDMSSTGFRFIVGSLSSYSTATPSWVNNLGAQNTELGNGRQMVLKIKRVGSSVYFHYFMLNHPNLNTQLDSRYTGFIENGSSSGPIYPFFINQNSYTKLIYAKYRQL